MVFLDDKKYKKIKNKRKPNSNTKTGKINNKRTTTKMKAKRSTSRVNKTSSPKVYVSKKNIRSGRNSEHNKNVEKNLKLKSLAIKLFAIEVILLIALSVFPLPSSYSKALVSSFNAVAAPIYVQSYPSMVLSISSHNLEIATMEMIPVIGPIEFVVTSSVTSVTAESVAESQGYLGIEDILSLFLVPDTWLELPAYAIAAAESIMLLMSLFNKTFKDEIIRFFYVWVFILIELLAAASIESGVLKLEKTPAFLLLWIPTIIIVYIFIYVSKRMKLFEKK